MASQLDGDPGAPPANTLTSSRALGIGNSAATAAPNPLEALALAASFMDIDEAPPARRTYVDQAVQVGEPWAAVLAKETHNAVLTEDRRFDRILLRLQRGGWSVGSFLEKLIAAPTGISRSQKHAQMVSAFMRGSRNETVKPDDVVELMYTSKDGTPKSTTRGDPSGMAQHLLREWAITKVEGYVREGSEEVSSKDGGFHMSKENTTWSFIHGFSLANAIFPVEAKGAVLLRILAAAVLPPALGTLFQASTGNPTPYFTHLSRPSQAGSGGNRKDSIVIIVITFLMLMYARNMHFSLLRKIAGIWLFSNNASASIFTVLSRIGLTSSYTTVLKTLRALSASAQLVIREKARQRAFLLIYDNINRMHRAWDPDLGQRDFMDSGTAATMIELMNCDVGKAFDPIPLKAAREAGLRKQLTTNVLLERIDMEQLNGVMALHCLTFLITDAPVLKPHQSFINLRFRTTYAKHRMPDGHITQMHPLATSGHDEGSAAGNRDVLDDLVLRQLGMEKSEVDKLLIIVGGDQSTVEKIRALQKFLADCPHGYSRYGWVLPLIQLWHMGWADLERILSTHWGRTTSSAETGDMSSFHFINSILKRKIKNVKRPDYYPAQNFIFDTLKAEIIDCWKVHLDAPDLNAYFEAKTVPIEDLLKLSEEIVALYLATTSSEIARAGFEQHSFKIGAPWPTGGDVMDVDGDEQPPTGDTVLANSILRMRDMMLHYEFQHAVTGGDIGRAMNIMAVWTFTFTGCGKSKYSNELLEIACNFEYEYSLDLQNAVLNNWLCTFTPDGCWFPMDQLQEKNIKLLKKMSERKDASFGAAFYQQVVSYNIRAFTKSTETMNTAVGLGKTGGRHRRDKKAVALKELANAMVERQPHKYRVGRDLGHFASDDFTTGFIKLEGGKVKDFIKRTMAEAGDLHGEKELAEEGEELPSAMHIPFPNVVIDGVLYCGGDSGSEDGSGSESD